MLPEALRRSLESLKLLQAGQEVQATPLTGGVSSEIWLVDTGSQRFCIKRALAKLKVAQDWFAPQERNRYEHQWYRLAHQILPGSAPQVLATDDQSQLFVMEYLPPSNHSLWKSSLLAGDVQPTFAAQVGDRLGQLHRATALRKDLEQTFSTQTLFEQLRLSPYLRATALQHPALSARLQELANQTGQLRLALVHGDVSPKNILQGPQGPVFLDAECAWYGDPAFDLAFCLNHLLLKSLVQPACLSLLLESFARLREAYLQHVHWEASDRLEARTAALLPGLLLARIDGKSPVEYLQEPSRQWVRHISIPLLEQPVLRLDQILLTWRQQWT